MLNVERSFSHARSASAVPSVDPPSMMICSTSKQLTSFAIPLGQECPRSTSPFPTSDLRDNVAQPLKIIVATGDNGKFHEGVSAPM